MLQPFFFSLDNFLTGENLHIETKSCFGTAREGGKKKGVAFDLKLCRIAELKVISN